MTIRNRITRLEIFAKGRDPVFDEADVKQALAAASDDDLEKMEAFLVRAEKDGEGPEADLYGRCESFDDLMMAARGSAS